LSQEFCSWEIRSRKSFSTVLLSSGILLMTAGLIISWAKKYASFPSQISLMAIAVLLYSLGAPLAVMVCGYRGRLSRSAFKWPQCLGFLAFTVVILVEHFSLRLIDPTVSSRSLATDIVSRQIIRPDQIGTYHVQRARRYQLSFYLHTELQEFDPRDTGVKYVITSLVGAQELMKSGIYVQGVIRDKGFTNEVSLFEVFPAISPNRPTSSGQVR